MATVGQGRLSRWLTAVAVGACALALGGCVLIKSQGSAQLDAIGSVQITTTACASDTNSSNTGYSPADPACQGPGRGGNSGLDAVDQSTQLLLGYRIPTEAETPQSFTTAQPSGAGAFTFSQSPSYSAALQAGAPASAGQRWVGYISMLQPYTTTGSQYFTVAPVFGLRPGPNSTPFQGPFAYRVVVGQRAVDGGRPAERPVTCGSSITGFDVPSATVCADSPSPAAIATNLLQPTADLGVYDASDQGPVTARQGNVARIGFDAVYAGDGGQPPTFTISSSTNVPGAEAMPSSPVLTPEGGSNLLRTIFRIPVDTPPGSYDVTFIASLPGGQVRTATRELVVEPTIVRCDRRAPTIAGTRRDDVLVGTRGRDVITSYRGDDVIIALQGDDLVCAGRGADRLRGGNGNDRLAGRRGSDRFSGGRGRDLIDSGPGRDRFIQ